MSNDVMEVLFPVLAVCSSVALLAGILALVFWLQKRNSDRWAAVASQLGLELSGPSGWFKRPEILGHYGEHRVRLYTYVVSSGKSSQTYTVAVVMLQRSLGLGLRVYREGLLSKLGKAVGTQDIETGDAAFDEALMVKGNDASAVVDYLTEPRRRAVAALIGRHKGMELVDAGLTITLHGWLTDAARIRGLLDDMEGTARILDGPAGAAPTGGGFDGSSPPPDAPVGGFRITDLPGS